jgi:hypothetical protein
MWLTKNGNFLREQRNQEVPQILQGVPNSEHQQDVGCLRLRALMDL